MKKLICSLCLVFAFVLTFAFGCNSGSNTQNNKDWVEVQSIKYDTASTSYFYESKLRNEYDIFMGDYLTEDYIVKVKFLENNCLEIYYYDYNLNSVTIRVLPLSYTITYFND